ncbi:hypothetical protein ACJX0J_015755, partial [Zea mays]
YAIANEPSHTVAHHLFLVTFLLSALLRSLWGNMYSLNHFIVFLCLNISLWMKSFYAIANEPYHTAAHHLFLAAFLLSALYAIANDPSHTAAHHLFLA